MTTLWYNEVDLDGHGVSGSVELGSVPSGCAMFWRVEAGESRLVAQSLVLSRRVMFGRGCHVNEGRGIHNAPASPFANFTDNRIHPYSLLQSRHSRGYRLPKYFSMGGLVVCPHAWKRESNAGCWKSVLSHIVNLWTRLGTHLPSQLTLLKNPTMTAVLTLSSGLRNIWNAPAVAPHGSLTLSTTFLLPVTAVSITASVSLPDVLSPALKLPVYARAGGFPMVIDRLRVDRRLYNTNRICQLEFSPIDVLSSVVVALIYWRLDVESGGCE